jgi:hypothetical protein
MTLSACLSLSNADDVTKVDILRSHKGKHASYIDYGAANLRWGAQRPVSGVNEPKVRNEACTKLTSIEEERTEHSL